MNWVDYLLLGLVALGAWKGLSRGLVRGVLGLVSLGAGLVAALKYHSPVGRFLDERCGLTPVLSDFYAGRAAAPVHGPTTPPAAGGGEGWTLPDGLDSLVSGVDLFLAGQGPAAVPGVPDALAATTLQAGSFLLVLLVAALAVGGLLSVVPRLPLLMPLDRAGGFCLGLGKGFVFGALAVGALKLLGLSGLFGGADAIAGGLEASRVAPAYLGFIDYVWKLVLPLNTQG